MASSNQRRNKAIMDKLIKDLSVFQEYFDETGDGGGEGRMENEKSL